MIKAIPANNKQDKDFLGKNINNVFAEPLDVSNTNENYILGHESENLEDQTFDEVLGKSMEKIIEDSNVLITSSEEENILGKDMTRDIKPVSIKEDGNPFGENINEDIVSGQKILRNIEKNLLLPKQVIDTLNKENSLHKDHLTSDEIKNFSNKLSKNLDDTDFIFKSGKLYYMYFNKQGEFMREELLCNFGMFINRSITSIYEENMVERKLEIIAFSTQYNEIQRIILSQNQVTNGAWMSKHLNLSKYIIAPSSYNKIYYALQLSNNKCREEIEYRHIGWVNTKGMYYYVDGGTEFYEYKS